MTHTITTVAEFLKLTAAFRGSPSMEGFVLEHGQQFNTMAPKQPRLGTPKECYRNAALLSMRKPDLIYVEGYALGVFPVLHAWCVDKEGLIHECTWRPELRTTDDYYGIPFSRRFLSRSLVKWQHYGLLDNWRGRFPVQHTPRSDWIHKDYER